MRNGFDDHYCGFEESIGRYLQDNLSVLCGYNISEYSNNGTISTMIAAHGYVILDEPFKVYRAPGSEIRYMNDGPESNGNTSDDIISRISNSKNNTYHDPLKF